jgi:hypothetical protein
VRYSGRKTPPKLPVRHSAREKEDGKGKEREERQRALRSINENIFSSFNLDTTGGTLAQLLSHYIKFCERKKCKTLAMHTRIKPHALCLQPKRHEFTPYNTQRSTGFNLGVCYRFAVFLTVTVLQARRYFASTVSYYLACVDKPGSDTFWLISPDRSPTGPGHSSTR